VTRKTTNKRLDAAANAIGSRPLQLQAIDYAYAGFLRNGELPEDCRLAWSVLKRALHARKPPVETASADSVLWALQGSANEHRAASGNQGGYISGPPREQVFQEAVHSSAGPRQFARLLISLLVGAGSDPTDPEFIPSDLELPEFGGVAMSALGWPDHWVKPPYEQQMQRVMQQHAALRAIPDRTDAWYRDAAAGISGFLRNGEVPADGVVRLFALTVGEMFAIHGHYFGRGGEELLAAFDAVAKASGEQREAALLHLGAVQARSREAG